MIKVLRYKTFKYLMLILIMFVISISMSYFFVITNKLKDVSPHAKDSVHAVLKAYYISSLTGGYWENEMITQSKLIAELELNARLDFYRIIIIYCNLDTSPAYLFRKIIFNDKSSLKTHLESYKSSKGYRNLNETELKNINNWILKIGAILDLNQH